MAMCLCIYFSDEIKGRRRASEPEASRGRSELRRRVDRSVVEPPRALEKMRHKFVGRQREREGDTFRYSDRIRLDKQTNTDVLSCIYFFYRQSND
jgi:hypothetical protein